MSKITIKFVCNGCYKELHSMVCWGSQVPEKVVREIKSELYSNHNCDVGSNFEIEYSESMEHSKPFLGKEVIYFNTTESCFCLDKIEKVEYEKFLDVYYIKHGKDYIRFDSVTYFYDDITGIKISDVIRNYNHLAYINENKSLGYESCNSVYSIFSNNKIESYIIIAGKEFEAKDVVKLSEYLMEFDKYNVSGSGCYNDSELLHLNKRFKEFRKFTDYWMNKYYK